MVQMGDEKYHTGEMAIENVNTVEEHRSINTLLKIFKGTLRICH